MKKLISSVMLFILTLQVFANDDDFLRNRYYGYISDFEKNQMYFINIIVLLLVYVARRIYNNHKKQNHDSIYIYALPIGIFVLAMFV